MGYEYFVACALGQHFQLCVSYTPVTVLVIVLVKVNERDFYTVLDGG